MAKRKQSRKSKMGIIVAVLLLAVGFAAVTTTLYINGTITIKPDTEDFKKNVIFTQADLLLSDGTTKLSTTATNASGSITVNANTVSTTSTASVEIDSTAKIISFSTETLNTIGQENKLTYTVGNFSQYDAKLGTVACKTFNSQQTFADYSEWSAAAADAQDDHYTITIGNETNNSVLPAKNGALATGNVKVGTITIKMVKSYVGTADSAADKTQYVYCAMPVEAQEATTAA